MTDNIVESNPIAAFDQHMELVGDSDGWVLLFCLACKGHDQDSDTLLNLSCREALAVHVSPRLDYFHIGTCGSQHVRQFSKLMTIGIQHLLSHHAEEPLYVPEPSVPEEAPVVEPDVQKAPSGTERHVPAGPEELTNMSEVEIRRGICLVRQLVSINGDLRHLQSSDCYEETWAVEAIQRLQTERGECLRRLMALSRSWADCPFPEDRVCLSHFTPFRLAVEALIERTEHSHETDR